MDVVTDINMTENYQQKILETLGDYGFLPHLTFENGNKVIYVQSKEPTLPKIKINTLEEAIIDIEKQGATITRNYEQRKISSKIIRERRKRMLGPITTYNVEFEESYVIRLGEYKDPRGDYKSPKKESKKFTEDEWKRLLGEEYKKNIKKNNEILDENNGHY